MQKFYLTTIVRLAPNSKTKIHLLNLSSLMIKLKTAGKYLNIDRLRATEYTNNKKNKLKKMQEKN